MEKIVSELTTKELQAIIKERENKEKDKLRKVRKHKEFNDMEERYAIKDYRTQKRVKNFMNNLIILIVISIIAYAGVALYIFIKTGQEPINLNDNIFRFFGVELIATASIQVTKNAGESFGKRLNSGEEDEC